MLSNTKSILSKSSIFLILAIFACQGTAAQETKAKGEYASVNGLKMYYEIHGTGQPLVLLHGSFLWATNYPTLSQGRQVIAIDMQGHGRTADINRPFTFEQMADDTAALLKHLKIEQADVFGYSMGGTIGLALAIRHPGLVRRLTIYGSVYRPVEESYPPDILKDFRAITPETFAPKELKEPYDKMSPAPNWRGLVAKIIQMERDFKGFSQEQMKAIKAEVFIGAGRPLRRRSGTRRRNAQSDPEIATGGFPELGPSASFDKPRQASSNQGVSKYSEIGLKRS